MCITSAGAIQAGEDHETLAGLGGGPPPAAAEGQRQQQGGALPPGQQQQHGREGGVPGATLTQEQIAELKRLRKKQEKKAAKKAKKEAKKVGMVGCAKP
jgi:Spy/CpxP family protein refolding chaperone